MYFMFLNDELNIFKYKENSKNEKLLNLQR